MTNVLDEEPLTPAEEPKAEEEQTPTESQGETQPEKSETESPAGYKKFEPEAKSVEHAIQLAREREKRERIAREQTEQQLEETKKRLEELELEGLTESERYRVEAERAKEEAASLKQQLEVENFKQEYRRFLASKEVDFPKTTAFLRKQADRNIYPVIGQNLEETETNFNELAADFEGTIAQTPKVVGSNPTYSPPEEVDINKLSAKELRSILPVAEKE